MWIFFVSPEVELKKSDTQPGPQGDFVVMATPLPVFALKHLCRALMTDARREGRGNGKFFFFSPSLPVSRSPVKLCSVAPEIWCRSCCKEAAERVQTVVMINADLQN